MEQRCPICLRRAAYGKAADLLLRCVSRRWTAYCLAAALGTYFQHIFAPPEPGPYETYQLVVGAMFGALMGLSIYGAGIYTAIDWARDHILPYLGGEWGWMCPHCAFISHETGSRFLAATEQHALDEARDRQTHRGGSEDE